ncbi:MAG: TOMM precursor leader peptide-binding protein [Symploca sp. SIO1C4]|uniref:TOMM leader peptide-binding protein n=1 Tax=Symploca sp. SIO1C4 TaxID=2607765 RepID=A0A6B3NCT4_9CYAN|nr:TOMM precursor leader peptide-binding protein [Symploca sp. SIO1C4]NET07090.1 TOMM precursor leader peptide-binding protein [Symploca sp. SIO2B6]
MLNKPKFKSYFQVEVISPDVFLLSEKDNFLLSGHLYVLLAPLLDGQYTVDQLIRLLQGQASAAEVYYALMLMEQKGYIVENDQQLLPSVEAFWNILDVEPSEASKLLKSTKVSVASFGTVSTQEFVSTLESLDVQVDKQGDLTVVLTDDYLQEGLTSFNQEALKLKRPWMLVKPVGSTIWLGPIFYPGKTGCWECLAQRLRNNHPVETYIQKHKGMSVSLPTSLAAIPSTWKLGLNLAATELVKWLIQGENKQLEGLLVSIDTISLKIENHLVVKRPQCPSCGQPEQFNREPLPLILKSVTKIFTADGGHRCLYPEETFKKYQHHISTIAGIIQALKSFYDNENGVLHSYTAGQNLALKPENVYLLRETVRSKSGGKGKTEIQAKASAICEAIERYSGVFQGDEIRHKDTYINLGDAAINPNTLLHFSEEQYKNRNQSSSQASNYQSVPEPFDENSEIEWTPVWSLTYQKFKYIPTAYCYYGYPKKTNMFCCSNSNGAAAGNSKEEAILQGFMELVERDSVALWWYNRLKRPAVNLDSFDEPYFQDIKDYYQKINREIWVLDLTADLSIPAFVAISRRTDQKAEDIIFGFGAHFDPKIGILRAITEASQILPGVLRVAADGTTEYSFTDKVALEWWQTATIKNQPYLVPDASVKAKVYSDYRQLWSDDFLEDVLTCVNIAKEHGMETLVLDQTRPDIGLNVVKVIVPGMRHFWKRLAPGRLYDVPVKLGWLPEPLKENQLNPFPMFL